MKMVKRRSTTSEPRALRDLDSIGPAMLRDFAKLGIETVAQLSRADPDALYERISALDGIRHDPCVLDTFRCAVAQARDPELPAAQRRWWFWSRLRKSGSEVAGALPSERAPWTNPPSPRRPSSRSGPTASSKRSRARRAGQG